MGIERKEGWKYNSENKSYTYVPRPSWEHNWDYDNFKWLPFEKIEDRTKYDKTIEDFKEQVLELGFMYGEYPQKCRQKDINLLNTTLATLRMVVELSGDRTMTQKWYHSSTQVAEYNIDDFIQLTLAGVSFVNPIYATEHYFKNAPVGECNSLKDFINKVNELSPIKVRSI